MRLLQSFRIRATRRNCYQTNLKSYDSRVHVRNLNILITNIEIVLMEILFGCMGVLLRLQTAIIDDNKFFPLYSTIDRGQDGLEWRFK